MQISLESNVQQVARGLTDLQNKQLPFASAMAMNEVAAALIEDNKAHMAAIFDKPTRWTLNAFHFRRATKAKPVIEIERKLAARGRHYLETQAKGGPRPLGGWEKQIGQRAAYAGQVGYIVPTKHMKRDGSGNISRAEMQRILSHIGAQGDTANNSTSDSRKRKAKAAQYFLAKPESALRPGVYKREGKAIARVLAFDVPAPSYTARFLFDDVMASGAARRLPDAFARHLARAMASAR